MPPVGTPSASSEGRRSWVVPASLRERLSAPYGPVLSGPAAEARIRSLGLFASCGDRVTADALELGATPWVGIVDLRTRRNEPFAAGSFARLAARRLVRVRNPPGELTEGLRSAVRDLVEHGGGLIEVDGEEDLGSLALVESLPAGATVIYGIPGAGVSFVTVDAAAKDQVRALIGAMELKVTSDGS